MKRPFAPQTNNNCYETDTHNVSLTGNQISTILYILEGYIDPTNDNSYDPDCREDIDKIFVQLEGVTDAYYERLEKLEYNRKHEERRIK